MQVNYVQDIISTGDRGDLGMYRKELIQVISGIEQVNSFVL